MVVEKGWRGRVNEHVKVGDRCGHAVGRTRTLAFAAGLPVPDLSPGTVTLGSDEVRFLRPVFAEGALYTRSEVLSEGLSPSRPAVEVVAFRTEGFDRDGAEVLGFGPTVPVCGRGHAPPVTRPGSPGAQPRRARAAGVRGKRETG